MYNTEREGQIEFFDNYGIDWCDDEEILVNNTDGIYNGNIFEFKLNISNVNSVLFQAIKYLSRLRIKGESVPAKILLISLNDQKCYSFSSKDYINDIQKVYSGAMSKFNSGFSGYKPDEVLDYSKQLDSSKLKKKFTKEKDIQEKYIPIDIDENCIVGWGNRYYRELPKANKGDFLGDETGTKVKVIGEIREPKHFKYLINPYKGKTNKKFKYLMDCLNDRLSKKDLGAFYTPPIYARKAAELVLAAVNNIPEGNDYVILDRCAGTGNLEAELIGLTDKWGDKVIDHVIVSTFEYYEYKVLNERLGHLVREIIPPSEAEVVYKNGKVSNADAMSKDFIENPVIKQYLDDQHCNFILFENPPYRDMTSGMTGVKSKGKKTISYVGKKMREAGITKSNEFANMFIWSALEYYLNKPNDCLVLFSPIKYWKADHLLDKEYVRGFIFNRTYFHSYPSAVSCIFWKNNNADNENLKFEIYDIKDAYTPTEKLEKIDDISTGKTHKEITKIFDKRKLDEDKESHYFCSTNGSLVIDEKKTSLVGDDIIGYIVGRGFGISNPNLNFNLIRFAFHDLHGFYLRKDNYLKYLPILAIKHYLMFSRKWYETEFRYCCTDNDFNYKDDEQFLKKCFIFANLNYYNKCLSIGLPDKTIVNNELCFDENTLASKKLEEYTLNKEEEKVIGLWNKILKQAKNTKKYNKDFTYGPYQIELELNTYTEIKRGNKKDKIYDYPELNGNLHTLKELLKEYFDKNIKEKLFKYELIK